MRLLFTSLYIPCLNLLSRPHLASHVTFTMISGSEVLQSVQGEFEAAKAQMRRCPSHCGRFRCFTRIYQGRVAYGCMVKCLWNFVWRYQGGGLKTEDLHGFTPTIRSLVISYGCKTSPTSGLQMHPDKLWWIEKRLWTYVGAMGTWAADVMFMKKRPPWRS